MEQFTEETRKEEEIKAAETASAVAAKRKING